MPQVASRRIEFIAGVRAFAPMSMGIVPFGVVCGAAASSAEHFSARNRRWQAAIAQLLTEQACALTVVRCTQIKDHRHRH